MIQSMSPFPKSSVRTKTLWTDVLGVVQNIRLSVEC